MNRRGFFRHLAARTEPLRPPWAVREDAFAEACNGCGDCVAACPQSILVLDKLNRPVVAFAAAACTFCGKCTDACRQGAFAQREGRVPWDLVARVGENCMEERGIACRACEDACPVEAFSFRPDLGGCGQVLVETQRCSGCGACVSMCPAGAIAVEHQSIQAIKEGAA